MASVQVNSVHVAGRGPFLKFMTRCITRSMACRYLQVINPCYTGLFNMDSDEALEQRLVNAENAPCYPEIMAILQTMLIDRNPHAQLFKFVKQHMANVPNVELQQKMLLI
ncbi:hypothetical protein AVEN_112650-1 [Araneus ventricosus]|uniref:Uncharacterized protein n=1 Tax=Araneus ventricosus TaxID=182803 RepID=A0A4Y2T5V8_ARAVE|nr:hypothetical protein AVEN_112650-1 [Araneus ventricosus]